ncbi:MAG: class I SAM-dependent methyltransferase [Desulfocapsaceae bacterium]
MKPWFNIQADENKGGTLFDEWPDRYDQWFETPIGRLVREYEAELLHELLDPKPGEFLLDVGCGTGIFTGSILSTGAVVVGLDISIPMVARASSRFQRQPFSPLAGNMLTLPFASGSFDKVYSMTALEFVDDAQAAVAELQRVTKAGGNIVLTTLNRHSPWAERRLKAGDEGHELFQSMVFRSPAEIRRLIPEGAKLKTAIHFQKNEDTVRARQIEVQAQADNSETGAFLAVSWMKNH